MEAQDTIEFAERAVLRVILAILALAILAGLVLIWPQVRELVRWAVALAAGLAAMLAGGIIGLLFAVPRREPTNALASSGYSGNDNLVKVSDWLTGALTGIALATAGEMAGGVWTLSARILPEHPGFALACIVGGFSSGFLMAYLRLRASLPFIFAQYDKRASQVSLLERDLAREKEARNREVTRSRSMELSGSGGAANTLARDGASRVEYVRAAMAAEYQGDPNKGNFGASAQNGDLVLKKTAHHVDENDMLRVDLEVRSVNPEKEVKQATFHLHPSFPSPVIKKPADPDGVVRTSVWIYETFTVGAIAEPGQVKLELDLSLLADIPQQYK